MKTTVMIKSPVKIGLDLHRPGDTVEVDEDVEAALKAAGAIVTDDDIIANLDQNSIRTVMIDASALEAERDAAIVRAVAAEQAVAERAEVMAKTLVDGAVQRATADLTRERDEAVDRAKAAEDRLAAIEAAKNGAADATTTDAPSAKAPKKGAAAKG